MPLHASAACPLQASPCQLALLLQAMAALLRRPCCTHLLSRKSTSSTHSRG